MKLLIWTNRFNIDSRRLYGCALLSFTLAIVTFTSPANLFANGPVAWNATTIATNLDPSVSSIQVDFPFTNIGPAVIELSAVYSTCGCTVVKWPSEPLKPGLGGKIILKIDVTRDSGLLTKTVCISADDVSHTTYMLTCVIAIPELVASSAKVLTFYRANPGEKTVCFTNLLDVPVTMKSVSYDCETGERIQYVAESVIPGKIFAVHVRPPPSSKPYSAVFDVVIQQTVGVEKSYRFEAQVD